MIKVVITAPKGAMDSMIVEEAWKNPELEITGCVGNPEKDYIGKYPGSVKKPGFWYTETSKKSSTPAMLSWTFLP